MDPGVLTVTLVAHAIFGFGEGRTPPEVDAPARSHCFLPLCILLGTEARLAEPVLGNLLHMEAIGAQVLIPDLVIVSSTEGASERFPLAMERKPIWPHANRENTHRMVIS